MPLFWQAELQFAKCFACFAVGLFQAPSC
jgi:hypothetical protein